jgi:TrmH family RNA methyltransferase
VQPRAFDPLEAERFAHNATDVLAGVTRWPSLAAAVADCRWVAGTTRRPGRRRKVTLAPRELAQLAGAGEASRRPLALVFGPEENGLTVLELALCHDVVHIPAHPAQPSLNLAQAVLLLAYELRLAGQEVANPPAGRVRRAEAPAAELEQFYAHLEAALLAVQFVNEATAPHRLLQLRRLFGRARLEPAEVRLLRGICRQVLWAARRDPRAAAPRVANRPATGASRRPARPR